MSPLSAGGALAAPAGAITEFSAGLSGEPATIVPGAEGNLWFSQEGAAHGVGLITPSGAITEFSAGLNPGSKPRSIALGPEGDLWFTDAGTTPAIGRITPGGAITEFSPGLNPGSEPLEIGPGPDGNLWFTDKGTTHAIGRITPSGVIIEFSAGLNEGTEPRTVAPGPDGNVWFTDAGKTHAIGRITPSGVITEFSAGLDPHSVPWGIAPGPDGNLWFTDLGLPRAIGRITPSGVITEFDEGLNQSDAPGWIAPGPDGNLWFTQPGVPGVGRITPSGVITEFSAGLNAKSAPLGIAPGPDGNMWFADEGTTLAIGQIGTGTAASLTTAPTVTGNDQAGSAQLCGGATWATWAYVLQPSVSLYGFDGYRWMLDGSQVATGQSYTPTESNVGHQLSCVVSATYPLLGVTIPAASASVTIVPPPPTITAVRETRRVWREGRELAQISRRSRGKAAPIGTTFSFESNEQSSVSLVFAQLLPGRTVAKKCVARTHRNAAHRGCQRKLAAGTLSMTGHGGMNSVVFQGRISAHRRLAPGHYTLTITATNSVGAQALPASLSFEVVTAK